MSFWKAIQQNILLSANNSSSVPITYNVDPTITAFVGVSEETMQITAIQVFFKGDQFAKVHIDQGSDGTSTWEVIDSWDVPAGTAFTPVVLSVAPFFRIRVENHSYTASTMTVMLQTAMTPMLSVLPRALDEHGNLKVGVNQISDHIGFEALISPNGSMRVTDTIRLVGAAFQGTTTDTNFWTTTLANGGTLTWLGSEIRLRTNTTSAGSATIQSVGTARYIGGQANFFRAQIQQDVPTATNTRRWGAFSATDGCFFELSGTTPRVVTRKNSVDTPVSNGSFNGYYGATLGSLGANLQMYEIYFNNKNIYFVIGGELLHTVTASATAWTNTLSLPVRIENTNGAITTDLSMYVRSALISRLGPAETMPIWRNVHGVLAATVLKYGQGHLTRVIVNGWVDGSTISLYDALTATNPIALIVPTKVGNAYPLQPFELDYSLDFYTGLTVVTANAATDVTIVYE